MCKTFALNLADAHSQQIGCAALLMAVISGVIFPRIQIFLIINLEDRWIRSVQIK